MRRPSGARPAVALCLALVAMPASAQVPSVEAPKIPFISVEGRASVELVPDTAHLAIGVVIDRPTAAAATAGMTEAAQAMVHRIEAEGIEGRDVETTSVDLSAIYPGPKPPSSDRPDDHPQGFRASLELMVTVRPPERAGALATALVDQGANTIEGVSYSSSDEAFRIDELRTAATLDARHKAEIYVAALGLHLGRVLEIETPSMDGGFAVQRSLSQSRDPVIPIRPGHLTREIHANVRWEIVP